MRAGTHCIEGWVSPRAGLDAVGRDESNLSVVQLLYRRYTAWDDPKTNSVAQSPRANYADWATATCRPNLVPTFVDRRVSRGEMTQTS
jgi:hypothetical protein